MDENMSNLFQPQSSNMQVLSAPPPPLPSQLVSNVISQPIPRYIPQQITFKQPVNVIRSQYVLPPNTTIQAPPQFHIYKSTQSKTLPTVVNVEQQPPNVVKFIPKSASCVSYQYKDPVIQQHNLPPQLRIEPVYIYNTEPVNPSKPLFLNYGKPMVVHKDPTSSDMKRAPKKRKSDEKKPKKQIMTKKVVKEFDTFNCTMETSGVIRKYCSDTEDPLMSYEKRNMHNNMERQRRIGMRNLYAELKKAIPTLDDRERVPKVNILKEAISYCEKVQREEKILAELRRQNSNLMMRAIKLGLSPKSIGSSSTSSASSYTEED